MPELQSQPSKSELQLPLSSTADDVAEHAMPERVLLHMPVDVRSISLAIIATILSLYALQWAKEVLVPILSGLMLSYALTPIVKRMERFHLPRAVGATLLLSAILSLLACGVVALSDQTDALIDTVPAVTERLREISHRVTGRSSTLERVTHAADELSAAAGATPSTGVPSAERSTPTSSSTRQGSSTVGTRQAGPDSQPIDVRSYMLTGTLGVAAVLGQVAVIFFVALFILASGNSFRRKMVKLAGNKLSQKKITVETLDEITDQIQRYLLVQIGVSLVVGVCTWLGFLLLGLHNAAAWGVAAGVTNLVPYLGAIVLSAAAAVVAVVQFGTVEMGLTVGAISFVIHTLVGNVLTPYWTGRASKMSPVAVFISVLIFGWLWGVWGLLLGVPILLVVKSVCDRVEDLKPVGELLGA